MCDPPHTSHAQPPQDEPLQVSRWQHAVAKHVRELCQETGTTTFDAIKERIGIISEEVDCVGITPINTLSKTLRDLRDIGFVRLSGDEYCLLDYTSSLVIAERCISRGERQVSRCLRMMNIPFEREKSMRGMSYRNPLRFDFYFKIGNRRCAIEFDGKQHTVSDMRTGGDDGLRLTKIRDRVKDEYCRTNGIHILRIPYTRFHKINSDVRRFVHDVKFNA